MHLLKNSYTAQQDGTTMAKFICGELSTIEACNEIEEHNGTKCICKPQDLYQLLWKCGYLTQYDAATAIALYDKKNLEFIDMGIDPLFVRGRYAK